MMETAKTFKMNDIGIMQGRLLPPINGKLQSFPGKDWRKEFPLAEECGFDSIELIFDVSGIEYNPLNSQDGLKEITHLCKQHSLKPLSVCANYFMTEAFVRVSRSEKSENIKTLEKLTHACQEIGVRYIGIPLLGHAEVRTEKELFEAGDALLEALKDMDKCEAVYALEMSLPADIIYKFLEESNHPQIKVNYDIGNSTSSGYNIISEIKKLQSWIACVHIKDGKRGGGNFLLGEGDTDLDGAFDTFAGINYGGPFILETQRGTNAVETAKRHLSFVRERIEQYYFRTNTNRRNI